VNTPKNYSWLPVSYEIGAQTQNKVWLLATSPQENFDTVCERQRGIVGASSGNADGVLFSYVIPDFYLKTGETVDPPGTDVSSFVPNPFDAEGTDDFSLWQPFSLSAGSGVWTPPQVYDSKARRNVGKDDLLALCITFTSAGNSAKVRVLGRCLFRWKI